MNFVDLFKTKPLIGMIHLPALPGAPYSKDGIESLVEYAVNEVKKLERAGLDGAIVENIGDVPLLKSNLPAYTIASMAIIVREVVKNSKIRIGVNMLRNACLEALSIAHISGGSFIRCNVLTGAYATDQGIIEGCASELLRLKRYLGAKVLVFGDVHVKHAYPIYNVEIEQAAADMAERGGADALIVSGRRSPDPPPVERVQRVKVATNKPVLIGSGISLSNVADYYRIADGLILGEKDFKEDGVWGGPSNEDAYRKAVSLCREIKAGL
jgi:membrane complex biogenesis BtpA family protein